jgi:hypothetical protein
MTRRPEMILRQVSPGFHKLPLLFLKCFFSLAYENIGTFFPIWARALIKGGETNEQGPE